MPRKSKKSLEEAEMLARKLQKALYQAGKEVQPPSNNLWIVADGLLYAMKRALPIATTLASFKLEGTAMQCAQKLKYDLQDAVNLNVDGDEEDGTSAVHAYQNAFKRVRKAANALTSALAATPSIDSPDRWCSYPGFTDTIMFRAKPIVTCDECGMVWGGIGPCACPL